VGATVNTDTGQIHRVAPTAGIQVVPAHVAHEVTSMLKSVVYGGTGKPSQIPGYTVAGKTGSAQKAGAHGYLSGKFVASFVGFAPASRPRVACLTMIDEPHGLHWGAVCAAPVVREMLRWSMHYLQIAPDAPELHGDGARPQTIRKQEQLMAGNNHQERTGFSHARGERRARRAGARARVESDPAVTAREDARGGDRGAATV